MLGLVGGMFALLALQNLAGIWLNLYGTVHDTASYSGVFPAMFASDAGTLHALGGLLIGINALLALRRTWRWPDRRPRTVAGLSVIFVAVASYLGFHFVQSGGDNAYSFGMEAAFLGVVLCEAVLLYLIAAGPPASRDSPTATVA